MHTLAMADYAAIVAAPGETAVAHGAARGTDAIPGPLRRRMSLFEINAARCALGLVAPETDETIVLASRYGGMETACGLLAMLAARETLSPSDFSISVHNAAPGLVSQIAKNRAGHSAVSGGRNTLAAGLTEIAARLAEGEPSAVLLFAEEPLPGVYKEVEDADDPAAAWLAERLRQGDDMTMPHEAGAGRAGVRRLIAALDDGQRQVAWRP